MSGASPSNPFCTRFFQPGAIPFYFPPPMSVDRLVERILEPSKNRLAIVGPHGSGKSTLLQHLLRHPAFSRPEQPVRLVCFHEGDPLRSRWRTLLLGREGRMRGGFLIVDGWEQMDRTLQWFVRSRAAALSTRILASAHSLPSYFHELWHTRIDSDVENHVLDYMLQCAPVVSPSSVAETHAWRESRQRHGQNLRESLFDMYDWYRDRVDVHPVGG